jgi:hypothetical protein
MSLWKLIIDAEYLNVVITAFFRWKTVAFTQDLLAFLSNIKLH